MAYPNVMVMDYLKETGSVSQALKTKATFLLNKCYQRLLTFKSYNGFSLWCGGKPETHYTAYALHILSDMQRVYPVDTDILRDIVFDLGDRQLKQGFWAVDGSSNRNKIVADPALTAYITWGMLKVSDIVQEASSDNEWGVDVIVADLLDRSWSYLQSLDPKTLSNYELALIANVGLRLHPDSKTTKAIVTTLLDNSQLTSNGLGRYWPAKNSHSLFYGYGKYQEIEITGLAAIALSTDKETYTSILQQASLYLTEMQEYDGTWGTTQATVQALQALTLINRSTPWTSDVKISVLINGESVYEGDIPKAHYDVLHNIDLSSAAQSGLNTLQVKLDPPVFMNLQCSAQYVTPWPEEEESENGFNLMVDFPHTELAFGETMNIRATVWNDTDRDIAMPMVKLPLPPGLSADIHHLEKLIQDENISQFEIRGGTLILYLPEISKGHGVRIPIQLKARFRGSFLFPGALAYAYYAPDHRATTTPVMMTVK